MTAQASDSVRYLGETFSICGVNGEGLLTPQDFGQEPIMMSTACWRGYICEYSVVESKLILDSMTFRNKSNTYPEINGVKPDSKNIFNAGNYESINLPCKYSGGLLVATGFHEELYVHMGFHPAWKFEHVHELIFAEGDLIQEKDCSELMSKIRAEMQGSELRPSHDDCRERVKSWIESTFSLDYRM